MPVLEDKRCLITGATGGLGREFAHELARRGAQLFLTGTDERRLTELSAALRGVGRAASYAAADLRDRQGVDALIDRVRVEFGGADILVNNAGVFPVGQLALTSPSQIDECLGLNLGAAVHLCRAFASEMVERRWGRIVNVASSSAYSGFANTAVYCASKHGLLGLSRALDAELRGRGVRVIVVSPGSVKTQMGEEVEGQDYTTFLEPREIAKVVSDVVSLDGSMVINELRLNRMVMK